MKILVCDDNKNFTGIVSKYLDSQNDMDVVGIAVNGKEAIDKIMKNQPDVVLLDLVMPELDGLGVMEKLVENRPEKMPKVILQSAISQEFVIKEALELGAYCFMLKPYELPVLTDRIRTAYNDNSLASTSFLTPPYNNEYINVIACVFDNFFTSSFNSSAIFMLLLLYLLYHTLYHFIHIFWV